MELEEKEHLPQKLFWESRRKNFVGWQKKILAMTIKLMNGRDRQKTIESPLVALACRSSQSLKIQFGALRTSQSPPRPASAGCHEMREFENFGENENAVVYSSTSHHQLERNSFGKNCSWLVHKFDVFKFFSFFVRLVAALIRFSILHKLCFTIQSWFLKNWPSGSIIPSRSWAKEAKTHLPAQQMQYYALSSLLGASEDAPIVVNVCKNVYAGWNLKFQQQVSIVRGLRKCKNVL